MAYGFSKCGAIVLVTILQGPQELISDVVVLYFNKRIPQIDLNMILVGIWAPILLRASATRLASSGKAPSLKRPSGLHVCAFPQAWVPASRTGDSAYTQLLLRHFISNYHDPETTLFISYPY